MKGDNNREAYGPMAYKTYETALFKLIEAEFGYIGGPDVINLFVKKIIELNEKYYVDKTSIKPGQMLWLAVEKNEKPSYGKKMKDNKLVPVILTLITAEDIEDYASGKNPANLRGKFLSRIHSEAYDQGGVLSETDSAMLLRTSIYPVSKCIRNYEKEHGLMIPRSGNIRDMGRTLTHKVLAIRNYKKNIPTPDNARMIKHSPDDVDRYIKNHMRVELLHKRKHSDVEIAFITGLSISLVKEHIKIIEEDL
jgi:hypothetical protein